MRLPTSLVVGTVIFVVACGDSSAASVTPSSPATVASSPSGPHPLDPSVALPGDFPKDFPVYPGARSTSVGGDSSQGSTTWAIRWETTDSVDKTYAFYVANLSR